MLEALTEHIHMAKEEPGLSDMKILTHRSTSDMILDVL